ncbi:phosphatase PAP2 family protein [Rhodococcus hoagii]|nr:phosphatase PAP2 family protein [Prescottella equi]
MTDMDQSVLNWMLDIRTPGLTDVVTVITHSGGTVAAFVISTVVTVALLLRRYTAEAVMVAGAMLSGWAAMSLLKLLFGRERPPVPERLVELDSYSFPSGHAMMSAILACVLGAVVVRLVAPGVRRIGLLVLLGCYTLAVGLSRVYLAAHWLTDVLAGWAFGIAWAALWIWAISRRSRGRTRADAL